MVFMGMILLLFFYFSKRKVTLKELETKQLELDYQKDLLTVTIEVQEEERRRIAQDLHDDISSKLNIVSLNSHLLTTPNLTARELSEISENIIGMVAKALDNSRKIAHDLLPAVLDKFGLHAGIEELCFEYNSLNAIAVTYTNKVQFDDADKKRHLHVFRIVQELISNSLRHGKASGVSLLFEEKSGKVLCTYSDNGKGFDTESIENKKGLGMKNIESRIIYLDGSITFNSVVGKGTNVIFNF